MLHWRSAFSPFIAINSMQCVRPIRVGAWRASWGAASARQPAVCRSPALRIRREQRRSFGLETLTTILIPPAVFGGLVITLWTYKCIMMVIFQNKIIYMPSVPPFSRSEKVSDYAKQCLPVKWIEHSIKSGDGTSITLLEGEIPKEAAEKHVVILYLQGNASSLPPRLPYLSAVLKQISALGTRSSYSIVALSYRGFWTSKGRPSQRGIELDAAAALQWIFGNHSAEYSTFVIWGQSIGAGVATTALSNLLPSGVDPLRLATIKGLLLETPFVDMRSMLAALYPQRWLPYRYLFPFLLSSWDSNAALTEMSESKQIHPRIMILQAGDDEIVPPDHAGILEALCKEHGLDVDRRVVSGALHTEVMAKSQGRALISKFFASFSMPESK